MHAYIYLTSSGLLFIYLAIISCLQFLTRPGFALPLPRPTSPLAVIHLFSSLVLTIYAQPLRHLFILPVPNWRSCLVVPRNTAALGCQLRPVSPRTECLHFEPRTSDCMWSSRGGCRARVPICEPNDASDVGKPVVQLNKRAVCDVRRASLFYYQSESRYGSNPTMKPSCLGGSTWSYLLNRLRSFLDAVALVLASSVLHYVFA